MFGIGFSELIVLGIIVLVLIGPNQLPQVMKTVAKFVREITKAQRDFTRTVNQDADLRGVKESVDEVRNVIQDKAEAVKKAILDEPRKS